MPIRALIYVSEAAPGIAGDKLGLVTGKLDQIVDDAARFNREAGVTGVLFFDGHRFLQYMEGPQDGLMVAYSRVIGSISHSAIIELQRCRVGQRRLPFWPMRWLPIEPPQLRGLVRADWTGFSERREPDAPSQTGMDLLRQAVEPYANAA